MLTPVKNDREIADIPPNRGGSIQLTNENLHKRYSVMLANRVRVRLRWAGTVAVTSSAVGGGNCCYLP